MSTTKTVSVDVCFEGDGRVICSPEGTISGGVVSPKLAGKARFTVNREIQDEAGMWNPVPGEKSIAAGLQVNIWADNEGYRELGRYFLALAELDSRADPGFHEHHEGLLSADGRTQLHVICRTSNLDAPPD